MILLAAGGPAGPGGADPPVAPGGRRGAGLDPGRAGAAPGLAARLPERLNGQELAVEARVVDLVERDRRPRYGSRWPTSG
ncbi:hypothetical protein HML84_04350 [Alcanivorax sp. IO_7]|nr:hypothetical protein HML84_04350 [Alcanivorax sp. IO_7]